MVIGNIYKDNQWDSDLQNSYKYFNETAMVKKPSAVINQIIFIKL